MLFSILIFPIIWLFITGHPNTSTSLPYYNEVLAFPDSDSVLQVGEELTYNVSYAFLDIGQVRITVVDKISEGGKTFYKTMAYIDSYKGIPFNLHSIYESTIDASLYSLWFRSRTKKDSQWHYFTYEFDYAKHGIYIQQGTWGSDKVDKRDTLRVSALSQDGLSLFYFTRANVSNQQTMTIPTVVSEAKGNTLIHFTNERTSEKIDAVDYPIDLVHFEGNAGFVGIFGLTGDFEGWFSNDAARVPILAKMNVLIGNIHIELMKWKRSRWTPPKYIEAKKK
jgi:hypothetical protein